MLSGLIKWLKISFSKVMFVLTKANNGMIKKLTGRCSCFSSFSNGEILFAGLFNGIVKARMTPAIVACMHKVPEQ